jgi:hypothetical protein
MFDVSNVTQHIHMLSLLTKAAIIGTLTPLALSACAIVPYIG